MDQTSFDTIEEINNIDGDWNDRFANITFTCTELASHQELFNSYNSNAAQCGLFEDSNEDSVRFKAWEASDPPTFNEGEQYKLTDAQVVSTTEGTVSQVIIRSRTRAEPIETREVTTTECTNCGTHLEHAHVQKGPEAPEIGWEYLECPKCGEKARPLTN